MDGNKRYLMLKTGFIISLVLFVGSAILFTQNAPGSVSRIAMLLLAISSGSTGLSFFLQMKQHRKSNH
jgi:hypothetical protein